MTKKLNKILMVSIVVLSVFVMSGTVAHAADYSFGGFVKVNGVVSLLPTSCPAGYTVGTSWWFNFCYKNSVASIAEAVDFGGFYSVDLNNPITGAKNCPSGYTGTQQTLSLGGVQSGTIYLCQKTPGVVSPDYVFGGMYGKYTFQQSSPLKNEVSTCDTNASLCNDVTGGPKTSTGIPACPAGYIDTGYLSVADYTGFMTRTDPNTGEPIGTEGEINEVAYKGFCYKTSSSSQYIDIGLRIKEAGQTSPTAIAVSTVTSLTPLHIAKGGVVYSVGLVAPTDPAATKALIKLADGTVKALRKFVAPVTPPSGNISCYLTHDFEGNEGYAYYYYNCGGIEVSSVACRIFNDEPSTNCISGFRDGLNEHQTNFANSTCGTGKWTEVVPSASGARFTFKCVP